MPVPSQYVRHLSDPSAAVLTLAGDIANMHADRAYALREAQVLLREITRKEDILGGILRAVYTPEALAAAVSAIKP